MSEILSGKVWKFGDNINTDLMLPSVVNEGSASLEDQARMVFRANRPGWVDEMTPGDFIVGGRDYGMGSSRPAARSLRKIGVGCLIAESINGLFFRNCVNFGMLALECPGVRRRSRKATSPKCRLRISRLGTSRPAPCSHAQPVPAHLLDMMRRRPLPAAEKQGYIAPKAKAAAASARH